MDSTKGQGSPAGEVEEKQLDDLLPTLAQQQWQEITSILRGQLLTQLKRVDDAGEDIDTIRMTKLADEMMDNECRASCWDQEQAWRREHDCGEGGCGVGD